MTKSLTFQSTDGSAPPSGSYGSVPPGNTSPSRTLNLKNTGDEAITSLRMWIEQASVADGEYHASVGGLELTGSPQEVLSGPLAAGASVSITEYVTTPAGLGTTGPDSAALRYQYDQ